MYVEDIIKSNYEQYNNKINQENEKSNILSQGTGNKTGEDSLAISEEGRKKAEEKRKRLEEKNKIEQMENEREQLLKQLENAREQGKAMSDSMNVRMKCMTIAMRIIVGDKVPIKDQKYLSKNDPELYGRAILMRTESKNSKKHKSITEDEESVDEKGTSDSESSRSVQSDSEEVSVEESADAEISVEVE